MPPDGSSWQDCKNCQNCQDCFCQLGSGAACQDNIVILLVAIFPIGSFSACEWRRFL